MRHPRPVPPTRRALVSAVVPCYNYGRYLPVAVKALLDQEGVDVEVIIVEDRSPDDSLEIARRIEAADPRVRVIAHAANGGLIKSANDGIAASTGDYVVLVSADDIIAPGSFARASAMLEAHPDMTMVYGPVKFFEDVPPPPDVAPTTWTVWDGEEWLERLMAKARNVITSPEAMVRGDLARAIPYDARAPYNSDLLMWLQLAMRGSIGRVNGPTQAYYRWHSASMSNSVDYLKALTELSKAWHLFFDEAGAGLPDAAAMRRRADERIATGALRHAIKLRTNGDGSQENLREVDAYLDFARRVDPSAMNGPFGQWYQANERFDGLRRAQRLARSLKERANTRGSEHHLAGTQRRGM